MVRTAKITREVATEPVHPWDPTSTGIQVQMKALDRSTTGHGTMTKINALGFGSNR